MHLSKVLSACLVVALLPFPFGAAQTVPPSPTPQISASQSQSTTSAKVETPTDAEMAERVRQEFLHAWQGYKQYAWGHDALKPLSKSYHDWYGVPLLMTPVDALDTMILMGMNDEADKTREYIAKNLSFDQDIYVKNFEITIRLLGGLLSSYQLTGDKRLLALADDLGTRLLPAFNSPTGMPYVYVNLKTGAVRGEVTNPAEVGTLLIEFGTLSKLTGKPVYYEKAKRALVEVYNRRSPIGLVGSSINVKTGEWTDPTSHISGGIDSYYEYLLKAWLLFDDKDCERMWKASIDAVNKYLADQAPDWILVRPGEHEYGRPQRHRLRRARCIFPRHARSVRRSRPRAETGRFGLQDVDHLRHRARGDELHDDENHLRRIRTASRDHRVGLLSPPFHKRSALPGNGSNLLRQPGEILPHRCGLRRPQRRRQQNQEGRNGKLLLRRNSQVFVPALCPAGRRST